MVGKRIQQLRQAKGLSLSELAERAGVSKSYLSTIEREKQSNPSIQFLEKVGSVLDVSAEFFLQENRSQDNIDQEWYDLIQEAMSSGVSKEQFREFLEFNKWQQTRGKR